MIQTLKRQSQCPYLQIKRLGVAVLDHNLVVIVQVLPDEAAVPLQVADG